MDAVDKALRYWNTVRYLKPVQIEHQLEKRLFRRKRKRTEASVAGLKAPSVQKLHIAIPELDYDEAYIERFRPDRLLEDYVELLHEVHRITDQWKVPEASHLWNYNLHYLEFLIPLVVSYRKMEDENYFEKWKEYIENWMGQASGDSMEPYTISLRIPNILICLEILGEKVKGTEIERKILDSIYRQYRFLLKNTELSLLANHYFENLKTIVICSVLFGEGDVFRKYFAKLKEQIREQILPDGVHFERSLMYHRIILEDVLRIFKVLDSAGYRTEADSILPTVRAMAAAMENIERGFDTVPLFNDAGNNVAKGKEQLLAAAKSLCGYKSTDKTDFPDAGYFKLYFGKCAVLFDCGGIGPSYMGGHSHCDCLSFELSADGHKIFSNSGTGQYQGTKRQFFRSTRAHNTMMIDDREQSELWGEHRAARRIHHVKAKNADGSVAGQYQSYQGDWFRRRLEWKEGVLTVLNSVEAGNRRGRQEHMVRQFFHLAPGYNYECDEALIRVKNLDKTVAEIRIPKGSSQLIHREGELTEYAGDFGQYLQKEVLEIQTEFSHKAQIKIEIRINDLEENIHG